MATAPATATNDLIRDLCSALCLRATAEGEQQCCCFLLQYQSFIPPTELCQRLCSEFPRKRSIGALRMLRKWLELRFSDFNRPLIRLCCDALLSVSQAESSKHIVIQEVNETKLALLKANMLRCKRLSLDRASVKLSTTTILSTPKSPLAVKPPVLLSHPAKVLAQYLCAIEAQLFAAVPISEFMEKRWTDSSITPHLSIITSRTNRIAQWVASNILVQVHANTQSHLVNKFIDVAYFCREQGNFASAIAIMQAFHLGYVARLRQFWKINKDTRVLRLSLEPLIDPSDNYHSYREQIRKCMSSGALCIPHLGIYQKDLTFADDGNPNYLPNTSAINTNKILLVGKILQDLKSLQEQCYMLSLNLNQALSKEEDSNFKEAIMHGLRVLPCRSESELEALSERVRPRIAVAEDSSSNDPNTTTNTSYSDYSEILDV